jgi:hypothetical protein
MYSYFKIFIGENYEVQFKIFFKNYGKAKLNKFIKKI